MKKPQDTDMTAQFRFLRVFFLMFLFFGIIGFIKWGLNGVEVAVILSLGGAYAVEQFAEKTGSFASFVYSGSRLPLTLRERLAGDVDKLRYLKTKKEFGTALRTANDILSQDPEHPEALFLKAGILWEGYRNAEAAKGIIRTLMAMKTDETASIRKWASTLEEEIGKSGE